MVIIGGFGEESLQYRSAKAYGQNMFKKRDRIRPMPSFFGDMGKAIKSNALLLVVFSALFAALPLVLPRMSLTASYLIGGTSLSYLLHRQVLFGYLGPFWVQGQKSAQGVVPKDSIMRFLLVSMVFSIAVTVTAGFIAYYWASQDQTLMATGPLLGMTILVSMILLWIALSAIGTVLPAAASGLPFSFGRALRAGRKTGLLVAMQIVLFPGLTWGVVMVLLVFANRTFRIDQQTPFISWVSDVVLLTMFMIPSVMTVVILVRAFKRAYPQD